MKFRLIILSIAVLLFASCSSMQQSASYDDLYYSPEDEYFAENTSGSYSYIGDTQNSSDNSSFSAISMEEEISEVLANDSIDGDTTIYKNESVNPYEDVLVDDPIEAREKRVEAFHDPYYGYISPSVYFSDAYWYASAYDPAFYNVIISGSSVWVEPKWMTPSFGYYSGVYIRPYYGYSINYYSPWFMDYGYYGGYYGSYYHQYYNSYYTGYNGYWGYPYYNYYGYDRYGSNRTYDVARRRNIASADRREVLGAGTVGRTRSLDENSAGRTVVDHRRDTRHLDPVKSARVAETSNARSRDLERSSTEVRNRANSSEWTRNMQRVAGTAERNNINERANRTSSNAARSSFVQQSRTQNRSTISRYSRPKSTSVKRSSSNSSRTTPTSVRRSSNARSTYSPAKSSYSRSRSSSSSVKRSSSSSNRSSISRSSSSSSRSSGSSSSSSSSGSRSSGGKRR